MKRSSVGSVLQALNTVQPAAGSIVANTPYCANSRVAGTLIGNTITLNVNNGTQSVNCFQVSGTVEIIELYGFVNDTTTFTNCTAAHFELYDSAAAVDLTKNNGVLSGMPSGTHFEKCANDATTMCIADNTDGALIEPPTGNKAFAQFTLTQKTGADTFIRFTYTSSDAPIAATLDVYVTWRCFDANSNIVAV